MDLQAALSTYKNSKSSAGPKLSGKNMQFVTRNQAPAQNDAITMTTGELDSADDLVFGKLTESQNNETHIYSARDEMKRLQAGLPKELSNCKLPKNIIESIYENPLIDTTQEDEINGFAKNVAQKAGVDKSAKIINELIERDMKIKEENERKTKENTDIQNVSVSNLEEMIGRIIEEKLGNAMDSIAETIAGKQATLSLIKESGEGKFLFLDSESNVYECTMKYKGKNKKKN